MLRRECREKIPLEKAEVHFDVSPHVNWLAVVDSGFESPFCGDGLNRRLIQAMPEAADYRVLAARLRDFP
jgi:hypothetical protein